MSESEIHCPFCGWTEQRLFRRFGKYPFHLLCVKCDARGPGVAKAEHAAMAWESRFDDPREDA